MLFQVSPTTFQVSSTCFQGVFQVVHVFSINCSNKFSSCSTFSQLFSSHFPVWNGHFSRSRVVPVPVSFVPIRHRGAGHRGAQRHGGGRRAGRAARGGGGDHGAAGDGTHRLHLPQLGTHWTLEGIGGCVYVMSRIWGELWF